MMITPISDTRRLLSAPSAPLLIPAWCGSGKRIVAAERHIAHVPTALHPVYAVGSLFTGIGGIDLAFVRAGFSIAWQVEIDPFCRKVLAKHAPQYWPNTEVYEDVRNVGQGNLKPVDVMVGGFPCQDISAAGKGRGIQEGTRSGLWIEFARIIGELRPRFVLLENVPAITYRDGTRVIADLAAMGYDAEWGVIPASTVGAPHRRDRWFCVAHTEGDRDSRERRILDATQGAFQDDGAELVSSYSTLVNASSARSSGTEWEVRTRRNATNSTGSELGNSTSVRCESVSAHVRSLSAGESKGRLSQSSGTGHRATQSIMGRAIDGLSRQLDSHRWPARPGQPQYVWEYSREITAKHGDRAARIRALGNAVVPQVVQPIAEAIRSILGEQDYAAV